MRQKSIVMQNVPNHFCELSPEQVQEFARFGFEIFNSLRNNADVKQRMDALCCRVNECQTEVIRAMNATEVKL